MGYRITLGAAPESRICAAPIGNSDVGSGRRNNVPQSFSGRKGMACEHGSHCRGKRVPNHLYSRDGAKLGHGGGPFRPLLPTPFLSAVRYISGWTKFTPLP